ncbi:MAG: response regulator transcription factor [Myxococcaceae bacterium]|nr:response regulator transcription factor [Myxococcaceae bacterium]
MARLLVVEDDRNLREALAETLVDEGYDVSTAATLAEARAVLRAGAVDVLVLDLMLPDGDGSTLCAELKRAGAPSRVLMLTARTLEDDVVKGFDAGADDYVAKPYRLKELLARIASLARRGAVSTSTRHQLGPFALDVSTRAVTGPEGEVALTRKEFDLLVALLEARGAVVSRDALLDRVWGDVVVDVHTVDNFISSLKKKLKAGAGAFEFKTVRGVGFRLVVS